MSEKFTYSQFEKLCGPQLIGSSVPETLWPTIFTKLEKQIFDAGDVFALASQNEDEDEDPLPYALVAARDLTKDDLEDQAWLLDHAWTFRAKEARPTLKKNDQLRARVSKMLLGREDATAEEVVSAMWTHVGHYRIASEVQLDEESCWYLLDEVGTAIERTIVPEDANVAMAPLFYPPAKIAFNVVWFVTNTSDEENEDDDEDEEKVLVEAGTLISVDVGRGYPEDKREINKARFEAVWGDLLDDEEALEQEYITKALPAWEAKLNASVAARKAKVDAILSKPASTAATAPAVEDASGHIKLWTDHEKIREYLTLPHYKLVEDPAEADIAWSTFSAADPKQCPNVKYVAEFHNENRFCNKLYLAKTVQETLGAGGSAAVPWLPQTFDATLELDAFLGQYSKNKKDKVDNWWISKPHAMARSMDMIISDDAKLLMRIGETGPKILCKYVARPATLRGRKFDLRLCALVRSFDPESLEVYLHDKVWVRTAANEYSQTDFEEYEKHFTVMNYTEGGSKLLNLLHDDFIAEFDKEKGEGKWAVTFERIKETLRQTFTAISVAAGADELEAPFFTNSDNTTDDEEQSKKKKIQRRALYGIDLMLDEQLNPHLLEITFSPDVNRACKFFPSFIDDVFMTLFDACPTSCARLC